MSPKDRPFYPRSYLQTLKTNQLRSIAKQAHYSTFHIRRYDRMNKSELVDEICAQLDTKIMLEIVLSSMLESVRAGTYFPELISRKNKSDDQQKE